MNLRYVDTVTHDLNVHQVSSQDQSSKLVASTAPIEVSDSHLRTDSGSCWFLSERAIACHLNIAARSVQYPTPQPPSHRGSEDFYKTRSHEANSLGLQRLVMVCHSGCAIPARRHKAITYRTMVLSKVASADLRLYSVPSSPSSRLSSSRFSVPCSPVTTIWSWAQTKRLRTAAR